MILNRKGRARAGTILVESAMIYPVLFLLIMGVILMGIAVFRYQQVSHISREASRWASVHGEQYGSENNTTAATPDDIFNKAVLPQAAGMPNGALTYTVTTDTTAGTITYTGTNADGTLTLAVTWNTRADGSADKRPQRTVRIPDATAPSGSRDVARYNTVSVTVTYRWNTGMFGTIPVSCTSVNTIFY